MNEVLRYRTVILLFDILFWEFLNNSKSCRLVRINNFNVSLRILSLYHLDIIGHLSVRLFLWEVLDDRQGRLLIFRLFIQELNVLV